MIRLILCIVFVVSLASGVQAYRWTNQDGLSSREHLSRYHGVNASGWSEDQCRRRMDSDHNRWGPGHAGFRDIRPVVRMPLFRGRIFRRW